MENKIKNKLVKPKWLKGVRKVKRQRKSEQANRDLRSWLNKILDYELEDCAYFITLRYKTNNKPKDCEAARNILRLIIRDVYVELFGRRRWTKYLPKSVCVIEKGKRRYLHSHLIINLKTISAEDLTLAFLAADKNNPKLNINFRYWSTKEARDNHSSQSYCPKNNDIVIEPIGHTHKDMNRVIKYITKEYNFTRKKIDFSNFFNEKMLFRISDK